MLLVCVHAAQAFNPPVDTAGPLTVKIEGPKEVTRIGTPVPIGVHLENKGDTAIQGTVEVKLIDAWRAESAEPVRFLVRGKGSAALRFKIIAGPGTYEALYPIHVLARFEVGGKPQVAHPILILETKFANVSEKKPWDQMELVQGQTKTVASDKGLEWQPFRVADEGSLALWQIPVHRSLLEVFGEKPQITSVGWQGTEPRSRGTLGIHKVAAGDVARAAIVMHPPWYQGRAGTILTEYPLALPKTMPIRLSFANAVQPDGHGDGVTFRVRVLPFDAPAGQLGEVLFQRHVTAKTWQAAEADLSRFAGQNVRIQLESHPGPKHDTGWDLSYWGEPTLVVGTPPAPPQFPPVSDEGSRLLGMIRRGDQHFEVRIWPGKRGLLDSVVSFASGDTKLAFRGFQVRVLGTQLEDPRSPIVLEQASEESASEGRQVRHHFRSLFGDFDLLGRLWIEHGVLRAKFQLEKAPPPRPWLAIYLEDVAAGSWSQKARQIYAGAGNVLRQPGPFDGPFEGHALSTSFVGLDFEHGTSMVQGVDVPPNGFSIQPATQDYALHAANDCQLTFIPTRSVWDGVRAWRATNGLQAAAGVPTAAGRFVFDLWGGDFESTAKSLQRAFRYGLTHSMVVWHNWQRWGYDYRLPEIYPPNPQLGTLQQMRRLIDVCKKAGVPFAPHDNYVDYYPDAEGFSYRKVVAFSGENQPVRAWLNQGRGAQSYRYRADSIEQALRPNLALVRNGLQPTAYFIDVWSSLSPYSYWTSDGRFFTKVFTRDVWRKQFAWIREQLGGTAPQISESGHDQLIGYLDGAQTNHLRVEQPRPGGQNLFVWPVRCEDAERTPWFDAAHHDRFILHGAGYPGRYEGGLDARAHGIYSDDYLATEVLTGHPGMVPAPFGCDVVRKYWLIGDLMRALALQQIEDVEFEGGAGGNLHRQHVRWSNGDVWVNRGESDWNVAGHVLPQYGFYARVTAADGPVEASLSRRDGTIVEMSRSARQFYVDGRQISRNPRGEQREANPKPTDFGPLATEGGCRLTPDGDTLQVTLLPQSNGPAFKIAVRWPRLPWNLPEPTHVQRIDEQGQVLSTKAVERDGDTVTLVCDPEAFQYRLMRQ